MNWHNLTRKSGHLSLTPSLLVESQGSSCPVSVLCAYYKENEIEMMRQSIHSANGLAVCKKLNLASGLLEAPEIFVYCDRAVATPFIDGRPEAWLNLANGFQPHVLGSQTSWHEKVVSSPRLAKYFNMARCKSWLSCSPSCSEQKLCCAAFAVTLFKDLCVMCEWNRDSRLPTISTDSF